MKVSKLIKELESILAAEGDMFVELSSDYEGNRFYKVTEVSVDSDDNGKPVVVLWPE